MDKVIAFDLEQQSALDLLNSNLKKGDIPSSSVSFVKDLLDKGQRLHLSEKQIFWVNRLGLVKPKPKNDLTIKLDNLEICMKNIAQTHSYVNPNTHIFAADLIKKGRKYGQLSEKQIYWVEELTKEGISKPAAIYCSSCNRKGHSSYSCWRRGGRRIKSKLPMINMDLTLSEKEEQEFSDMLDDNITNAPEIYIDPKSRRRFTINSMTDKGEWLDDDDDDYIGNWKKDNMPDIF